MPQPGLSNIFPTTSARHQIALAVSLALAASAAASAADAQESGGSKVLPKVSVEATAEADEKIKVDAPSSPKLTQPLLDTPQTMTVVPKEVLRRQGASTLIEALRNTPGITLQLGENGNTSTGDAFSIRGSTSQTNVFVDGIRDLGPVTRDIFNIEQVEIVKGAVGGDYGRGAIAGYVNMVSKLPQAEDFGTVGLSAHTGVSVRGTGDLNRQLGEHSAVRVNAVWQDGDVVGRDFVEENRWGVAPSLAFGLGTPTRIYVYSQHVRADNVPDGAIPSIGLPGFHHPDLNGVVPARVDRENFYGRYDDFEDIKADMGTLRIEHDFSEALQLINSTRYGKNEMERILTGVNALAVSAATDPATWEVARTRQYTFQDNKLLTNQTNLKVKFNTGSIQHDLATGLEFIKEEQVSTGWAGSGTLPRYLNRAYFNVDEALNLTPANLYHPDPYFAYSYYNLFRTGADSDGETKTYAIYAFDTLKFNEQWLVNAGARFERFETDFYGVAVNNDTGARTITDLAKKDNLISWKAAVVFKPVANGSVYLSVSNSLTPPGNDNFTLNATVDNINNPRFDPQEATNIELGTKWDVLDGDLALNAAIYRTDNKNQLLALDAATQTFEQVGKRRVQGIELNAIGNLTDNWQLIAGLAWSDNEQVEGTSGNNSTGATARWAPEYSANLWTTYTLGRLTGGLGGNYVDEQQLVVNPTINVSTFQGVPRIPSYVVFDALLSYAITDSLNLQLNVYNLLDKEYVSSLNNGGSRLRLGAPRYAQLAATFNF